MSWTLTTILKGGKMKRTKLFLRNKHGANDVFWWCAAKNRMGMNPNVVYCWISPD